MARLNLPRLSRLALRNGYGGVAGHYALVGDAVIRRQHAAEQFWQTYLLEELARHGLTPEEAQSDA